MKRILEMKTLGLFFIGLALCCNGFAQEIHIPDSTLAELEKMLLDTVVVAKKHNKKNVEDKEVLLPSVADFLKQTLEYRAYRDSVTALWNDIYAMNSTSWARLNPDYYKLVMPATYYFAPIQQSMSIDGWKPVIPFIKEDALKDSVFQVPSVDHSVIVDRAVNRQLLNFYLQYPNLVVQNEANLRGLEPLSAAIKIKKPQKEDVMKFVDASYVVNQVGESELLVMKPNFWNVAGNGYLQASQNYISDNWYRGGESTVSLLSGLVWQFNYNDKQRLQFENKIEWKLGFITAPSDTVHQYKTTDDMLRLTSKLGYRAFSNWYYTLSGEFKTQLFSKYNTNSDKLVSSILSPSELNVGLGMDYKYKKSGVCDLSVLINPFNYTRYSIISDKINPTKFNIEEGKKVANQWGSRLEATVKWSVLSNLLWDSRFFYNTNYERVVSEWENTFTFAFNKYFSTKLFLHVRFDDSVSRKEGDSFFQFKELMSLGFNYTW